MPSYWGELPGQSQPARGPGDLMPGVGEMRAVEVKEPPLHQPSAVHKPPFTELPPEQCNLTIHTIQLAQHVRRLRSMLQLVQAQQATQDATIEDPSYPPLPQEPPPPESFDEQRTPGPLSFTPRDPDSEFMRGFGETPSELSSASCWQLLRKAVGTICAHSGWESANESALDTLTDIAHEYSATFCRSLRAAVDQEARTGTTDFPDVMEQVFHEMGVGSITSLQTFWQTRMVDYHGFLQQQSRQLAEEYERVTNPDRPSAEEVKPVRVKEEPFSDIQFPLAAEEEHQEETDAPDQPPLHFPGLSHSLEHLEESSNTSSSGGSPKWSLPYIKTEPQDSDETSQHTSSAAPVPVRQFSRPPSGLDAFDDNISVTEPPHTPNPHT
ncbi:STAGA complex 65 subunit gamma-like isoform X5 [Branchiostoma floridae x Branchiostoma belcheri]